MAVGWRTLADARNRSFLRDGLDFIWTRCTDDKDPNRWLWQTPAINRSSISHHLLLVFSFFLFIYFLLLGRDIFYFFPVLSDDRVVHALVILHFYVPEMSGLLLIAGRKPLADNNPQRLDTHTKKKQGKSPKGNICYDDLISLLFGGIVGWCETLAFISLFLSLVLNFSICYMLAVHMLIADDEGKAITTISCLTIFSCSCPSTTSFGCRPNRISLYLYYLVSVKLLPIWWFSR